MPLDKYSLLFSTILGVESLSYAIVLPLVPFIAQQYGANALVIGGVFALYSICQLVSSPLIGALSDRWGRKPLLLLSQATTCAGFLILALSNSLGLIFLSRVVDGASAGNVSLIYTAVLDRYPREARTRVLGLLSTGIGLGLLAGPLIGGLLGTAGLALPAFLAAGLAGITVLLTGRLFPGRGGRVPTGGPAALRAALERGYRARRSRTPPLITPYVVAQMTLDCTLDISKARRLLGYRPAYDYLAGFRAMRGASS